ncbi:hypothetical protein DKX38_019793 [Salix brachista]|uniref:DUF4283 domain-containing protein n=1 Tax=Salix brachista TaxID=2182728 RepID=A0A5N5KH50_9ROSI|nr:hypothetical protein DKX38_019793 [Salix brachista]
MTNHHHLNSNTHLSSHEHGEGSHEQGHAAKAPLVERTTSPTSWADRVKVTDSTTRHTLEPIPQKPAGYRLKIPAGMPMLDTNQWSRCMIGFFTGCRLPYHAVNTIARKAWGFHGLEQVLTIGDGFLIFHFNTEASVIEVIEKGPWMRLDYARLCVELDANLPFIHHFEVESPLTEELVKVTVEYEWKLARCETCRSFGHNCRHQGLETAREGKRESIDILQREERPMQREGKQIARVVNPMRSVPSLEPCLTRQQDSTIKQPTPNKQMSESSRQNGAGTEGLNRDT